MKQNIIEVMASVPLFKRLAKDAGLFASFVPVIGRIEILQDGKPIAVSYDGRMVKVKGKFFPFEQFFNSYKLAKNIIGLWKLNQS